MRLFIRYAREERVKYISHLDLMRTFQRALRRARIPVAYSEGFNPHPRLAFASALAVGVTSSDEYMDIILEEPVAPEEFAARMNSVMPMGLPILDAVQVDEKVPSLMSMIERASYQVELSGTVPGLKQMVEDFLSRPAVEIEKQGKKGLQLVDIKPGIYMLRLDDENGSLLHMLLQTGSKGNIKPETVVQEILRQQSNGGLEDGLLHIHRDGQYIYKEGEWVSPLALKY